MGHELVVHLHQFQKYAKYNYQGKGNYSAEEIIWI